MRSTLQILVLSMTSAFLLSSCRFVVENDANLVSGINSETQSCVYLLHEGDKAQFHLLKAVNMKTALFEKEYNSALLEGILTASLASSLEFVARTDLALYKAGAIKSRGCSRDLFASLPVMPEDIAKDFKDSEAKAAANKGTLLGAYFPKDEKGLTGLPSILQKPVLIVRDNTNRWTLLHEFMHHLFKTREQQKGIVAKELEKKMFDLQFEGDKIRFDVTTTKESKLEKLTLLFAQYADVLDGVVVSYPLEEVAIEVLLKSHQSEGLLKFAPTHGNAYIASSLIKADELIGDGIDFGLNIIDQAEELKRSDLADQLMVAVEKLSARASEIALAYEKHAPKNTVSQDTALVSSELSSDWHAGCGHAQDFSEISNSVKKLRDLKF